MDTNNVNDGNIEMKAGGNPAALVSALTFVSGAKNISIRITVERDLSVPLSSFTVSYRFSGKGMSGKITESRFFTLVYDRESLNIQETLSLRVNIPDGYNAMACTAFVSRIDYADGSFMEYDFESEDAIRVRCELASPMETTRAKNKKKAQKKTRIIIIASAAVCVAALVVAGGLWFNRYNGILKVVNGLIEEKRYGEAYRIAEECSSPTLVKTTCGNIISDCFGEKDFKTAYAYASVSGKQKSVFKRVEYEMQMAGRDAIESDAFTVLKKLDDDREFDSIIKEYIEKMTAAGEYTAAMTAILQLRNEVDRNLLQRNVLVEGACHYARDDSFKGMERYDRALDFFHYYETGNLETDRSVATEIVNKAILSDDSAGALVMSSYFRNIYPDFEIDPSTIEIEPGSLSIAHSLDYVYPLLSPDQKRIYHSEKLAVSEEYYVVRDGYYIGSAPKKEVSVATYENRTAVIKEDGTVEHVKNNGHNTVSTVPSGIDAVQIAVGLAHTVILNADGTVVAIGDNSKGQCNVSDWSGIVEIAAGRNFTVGLKSDGTLVACGSNKCGECHVSGYNNVISVKACDQTTVILFSDGTVRLRGYQSMGLSAANNFKDIAEIKAGGCTVIARKNDGSFVMADGSFGAPSGDISSWTRENVAAYAVGSQCIAYQNVSGKVHVTGVGA